MLPIEFGFPIKSLKYWLLQLFPIFYYIREFFQSKMVFQIMASAEAKKMNYLGFAVYMYIGLMFSGFIVVVKYLLSQHRKNKILSTKILTFKSSKITVIKANSHKHWAFIFFLIIAFITLIDGVTLIVIETLLENDTKLQWFQLQATELIFCAIVSRVLFKKFIYIHQCVAIVLVCSGVIVLCSYSIEIFNDFPWKTIGMYFGCFILWGIQDPIYQWLMEVMFIEPETILFFQGLLGLVVAIILGGFEYGFDLDFRGEDSLTCYDVLKLTFQSPIAELFLIGYTAFTFMYNYMLLLLTKYYSPTQKIIADLVLKFAWIIYYEIVQGKDIDWKWSILMIGFCCTLIGCLIYDEILIINMCGLGINTKHRIIKRSKSEVKELSDEIREGFDESINDSMMFDQSID